MSFTTLTFVIFFAVTAAVYCLLPRRAGKYWLLAASYVFYLAASPAFCLLLLAGTLVSYLAALAVRRELWGRRTLWTALGVAYTFGVLFVFKYADFFRGSLLALLGLEGGRAWSLALPVGISFFSFAVAGYLFDVHRGRLEAERNFGDYALFVAFFPTLLAGPIGRAREFLPQLREPAGFDFLRVRRGALRFVWGAFKKMAVADLLGGFVDAAYADPAAVSGGALLLAALCYSLQIYYDFSAYSDMAIGAAQVLGFRVMENFRAPYLSVTVKSFWKKWHISLTSWFREYLYFPLGGSRVSRARTMLNVLIVFAVSGLWHGAAWTFVLWGLLNGLYQVAGTLTEKPRAALRRALHIREDSRALAAFRCLVTFGLLTLAWVLFRAESLDQALFVLRRIGLILRDGFGLSSALSLFPKRQVLAAALLLLPCFAEDVRIARGRAAPALERTSFRYWGVMLVLLLAIALFGVYGEGFDPREFVYFSF